MLPKTAALNIPNQHYISYRVTYVMSRHNVCDEKCSLRSEKIRVEFDLRIEDQIRFELCV
jgi:hypothetical protein